MRAKSKRYKFICEITEDSIKVIKILKGKEKEIIGLEKAKISSDTDDAQISKELNQLFRKLKINKEPIIISLPRISATLRYLKVPSDEPEEIEKIVSLQTSRYLPYPLEELIIGYTVMRTDIKGYSHINLAIVHRDVIYRLVYKILKDYKDRIEAIGLSSYGLCNWYKYAYIKKDLESVMIIDIDSLYTEIAVLSEDKLLFSRAFKMPQDEKNFKAKLIEEINNTKDTYLKEVMDKKPTKIILTGKFNVGLGEVLKKEIDLPIETISEIKYASGQILSRLQGANNSFTALIGLGLEKIEDSLNLLPKEEKEKRRKSSLKKERIKIGLLLLGILVSFSLGLLTTFYNKVAYLNKLKSELNKILPEAKAIDEMKKRGEVLRIHALGGIKTVDVLYELHRLLPQDTSLVTLIYEEEGQVILRGQAQDLSSVFKSISILEKSGIFKNPKVRYATKRKTQTAEVVDFEIVCQMKPRITGE